MAQQLKASLSIALIFGLSTDAGNTAFAPGEWERKTDSFISMENENVFDNADPCAGEEFEQDCRDTLKEMEQEMMPIHVSVTDPDGEKACYAGLAAQKNGGFYLNSFEKVACGSAGNPRPVNDIEAIEMIFNITDVPNHIVTSRPFSPEGNYYDGDAGNYILIGKLPAAEGGLDNFYLSCASEVRAYGELLFPNCD